jgi:hypothetical protein
VYAYQLGGVCVSIRGCTRINWGVYVYQLGGVYVSNWGVYVYQLGGVRVSFRGCMIIVDLKYNLNK